MADNSSTHPGDGNLHALISDSESFPVKLHRLLTYVEVTAQTDIVSWSPDGRTFRIKDKKRFAGNVMPKFFSNSSFKTFKRNLSQWGFHTIKEGIYKGECSHGLFVRGNENLCRLIVQEPPPTTSQGNQVNHSRSFPPSFENPLITGVQANLNHTAPSLLNPPTAVGNLGSAVSASGNISGSSDGAGSNQLLSTLLTMVPSTNQTQMQAIQSQLASLSQQNLTGYIPQQPFQGSDLSSVSAPAHQTQQSQQEALLALLLQQLPNNGSSMSGSSNNGVPGMAPGMDIGSMLSLLASTTSAPPAAASTTQQTAPPAAKQISTWRENAKLSASIGNQSCNKSKDLRAAALRRGAKILPCKARGMPMEHDSDTAFFEVEKDAGHGSELVCSFPECRNSGVRFLYCLHCDAAISRRGFKNKHTHKDLEMARDPSTAVSHSRPDSFKWPPTKVAKREGSGSSGGSAKLPDYNNSSQESSLDDNSGQWFAGSSTQNSRNRQSSGHKASRSKELKREWRRLLEECRQHPNAPDASQKKSKWMQKVAAIYDEYSSLGKPGSEEAATATPA